MTDDKFAGVAVQNKRTRLAKFRQYLATSLVSLLGVTSGFTLGWTSPMGPLLMSDQSPIPEKMDLHNIASLGSISSLGSLVCCLFWGSLVDKLGRKPTAILLAVPYIISWIMIIFANSSLWLLIARFLQGFGFTASLISVPLFISEVVQDDLRGLMVAIFSVSSCIGTLYAYVVGTYFQYYVLAISCLVVPCIFLLTFPWIPESPMYLWSRGKEEEAKESLLWYRGGDISATEEVLSNYKLLPQKNEKSSLKTLFASRGTKQALKIGIAVMIALQGSCYLIIITYAVNIFEICGTSMSPYEAAIIIGTVQLIFTMVNLVLVDRLGRRILVVSTQTVMVISLTVLGTYLVLFSNQPADSIFRWLPIVALSAHIAAFSVGLGALFAVIFSEIFPPEVKGLATSMLLLIGCLLDSVSLKLFPNIIETLHLYGLFFLYSFLGLLSGIYLYIYLPETKNIPPNVIMNLLNGIGDTIQVENSETQPLKPGDKAKARLYS